MRRSRAFTLSACTRRRASRGAVLAMAAVFAVAGSPGAASATAFAVSSTSPTDGQAQHSVAQVSATYNQAFATSPAPTLTVCTGTLVSCSGGLAGQVVTNSPADTTVIFLPTTTLPAGAYTATTTATSAANAGDTVNQTWHFLVDQTAPVVQSTSPADATKAKPSVPISATYDEPLDHSTSTISLVNSLSLPVLGSTSFSSDSKTIIFTPMSTLSDGDYTASTSVHDVSGNGPTTTSWTFTTDSTPPSNSAKTPANNTAVTSISTVTATYNEHLGAGAISVTGPGGGAVAGASALDAPHTTVTFTENVGDFTPDGVYNATATVQDDAGNQTTTPWSFWLDTRSAQVTSKSPASGADLATAPGAASATYDEPLAGSSTIGMTLASGGAQVPVAGTTTISTDKLTITFTPAAPLQEGVYTVNVSAQDLTSHAATPTTWSFTVDKTAPGKTANSPAANTTVQSLAGGTVTATYNEALDPGNSSLTLFDAQQHAVTGLMTFASGNTQIVFTPNTPLTDGAYSATADVKDPAGNHASPFTWSFTIDGTAPVEQSTAPADQSAVQSPSTVSATFNEVLDPASTLQVCPVACDGSHTPVAGTTALSSDKKTITFTPQLGTSFAEGAYAAVANVKDPTGNTAAELDWSFTVDNTAPHQQAMQPANNSTVTSAAFASATYDEALAPTSTLRICAGSQLSCTSGALPGTASFSGDKKTILFVPSSPLTDGAYTATAAVGDAAGNTTTTTWHFTVNDGTGPVLQSTSPVPNTTVQSPASVTAGYDEPLDATNGSFSFTLTNLDTSSPVVGTAPNGAVSGDTISFTPASKLATGHYEAIATVQDVEGNQTVTTWDFVVDNSPPVMTAESPTSGATVIAPSAVSATYDQALDSTAGQFSFTLTNTGTNQAVTGNPAGGSVSGSTITFTPSATLPDGTYQAVATVHDAVGNATTTTWSFTVDTPPVMTSTSPADAATVQPPSSVSATYDKSLDSTPGNFSFTLTNTDTGNPVVGSPPNGAISGSTITFTPASPLAPGAYQANATVQDASGMQTVTSWNFTVDNTPPSLVSTSPIDGTTVTAPSTVTATYNEALKSGPSSSITLTDTDTNQPVLGNPPGGSVSGSTITFTPASKLAPGNYHAVATVQDAAGNPTTSSWNFTVDNTPPVLVSTTPGDQSTVVNPPTVSATYDKALNTGAGTFSLVVTNTVTHAAVPGSISASGSTVTFTAAPSAPGNPTFADGTYQADARVQDTAGNMQTSTWTFTVDNSAPANVSVSPANGSVGSAPATVTATFNEPLVASGSSIAVDRSGTPVAGTTTLSSDKMTLVFTPDSPLADGSYAAAAIAENAAGNSGEKDWSFTIDSTGPVNTAKTPAAGSTVASAPTVSAAFNEALSHATSTLTVKNAGNTAIAGSTAFSPDSKTITFTPTSTFVDGAYTATAAVKDAVGNASTTTWSFTVDNGAPAAPTGVTMTNPVNSANVASVVVSGSAEPGSHVSVSVDDASTSTPAVTGGTNADSTTGAFSVTVNLTSLRDGVLTATATATDGAGNTGPAGSAHATKDTVSPTSAVTPASSLTGGITITFSEPVSGVSSTNVVLRPTDGGSAIAGTLRCRDASAATVACAGSSTRSALLTPTSALTSGQHYSLVVNPAGATPVTDAAGNAAATTSSSFRGATSLDDAIAGLRSAWRTVSSSSAYGSSYATEHLKGARGAFRFTGSSLTWYTVTGPDQGLATVSIDGHNKGTVNNYAASRHFRVARAFSGLGGGTHTIVITVVGKKGSTAGTGTAVSIDAFRTSTLTSNPAVTYSWARLSVTGASGGSYGEGDLAGSAVSFVFRGTSISWVTVTAADQGRAAIYIDGKLRSTVDNYSSSRHFGVKRTVGGLSDTVHTLRIVVLGKHHSGAKGSLVAVDRFIVG